MGPLALSLVLRLSPVTLAHWAAWATGQPAEVAQRLVGVCYRESRCRPLSLHELDERLGVSAWGGQTQLHRRGRERGLDDPGHLDPDCQPKRRPGPAGWTAWDWSTRGAFGLQAAAHWQYLPRCYHPKILDHVLVSALVAARKWAAKCPTEREFARRRRTAAEDRQRLGWCAARRRRPDLTVVTRSGRRGSQAAPPR
jgi:hypothetical protein